MEKNISNLPKDVMQKLALELDYTDILNLCNSSSNFNSNICDNETFWLNKLAQKCNSNLRSNEICSNSSWF